MTRLLWNGYTSYVVLLLCLVNVANYGQRMVVSILLPAIKAEVALTDAQLGLLMGGGFAVVYAVAGVPLARLADGRVLVAGGRWCRRGSRSPSNA